MINWLQKLLALTLLIGLLNSPLAHAYSPYGGFNFYTVGDGRVLGMGGTFVALTDGAAGATQNPAGPALGKWSFDVGAANNRIDDEPTSTATIGSFNPNSQAPFSYQSFSIAAQVGFLAFGAGYSTPFRYEYAFNGTEDASLRISSIDAFVAARLTDAISIGVSGHSQTLAEHFESGSGFNDDRKAQTMNATVGVAYKGQRYGFGATYTPGYKFDITEAPEPTISNASWFRAVQIPDLSVVGGFYRLTDKFLIALDVANYSVPTGLVAPASGISDGSIDTPLKDGATSIIRGGFEWTVANDKKTEIRIRGGAYNEPVLDATTAERLHTTFGLLVRFGPAVLEVSFDQGKGFTNTSQGFSVSIGSI